MTLRLASLVRCTWKREIYEIKSVESLFKYHSIQMMLFLFILRTLSFTARPRCYCMYCTVCTVRRCHKKNWERKRKGRFFSMHALSSYHLYGSKYCWTKDRWHFLPCQSNRTSILSISRPFFTQCKYFFPNLFTGRVYLWCVLWLCNHPKCIQSETEGVNFGYEKRIGSNQLFSLRPINRT